MRIAADIMPNVAMCANPYDAAEGADALVIVTEWDAYRGLDLHRLKSLMHGSALVDLRNIYSTEQVEQAGFAYISIGRGCDKSTD